MCLNAFVLNFSLTFIAFMVDAVNAEDVMVRVFLNIDQECAFYEF